MPLESLNYFDNPELKSFGENIQGVLKNIILVNNISEPIILGNQIQILRKKVKI